MKTIAAKDTKKRYYAKENRVYCNQHEVSLAFFDDKAAKQFARRMNKAVKKYWNN